MSQTLHQLIQLITQLEQYDQQSITDLEVAIQCLDQVYQIHPKAMAKQIDKIINIFELCLTEHSQTSLISISHFLDFICGVVSSYPKLAKNNKNRSIRLLKNCLNILTKMSQQVPQSWLNPPNGYSDQFNEENPTDNDLQKQVLVSFDILAYTIGRNQTAALFEPIFKEYLWVANDWRYPYSAIVSASQIGSKSLKMQAAHYYVESAIMHLNSPYPKVRYACLHLIGMFSDQMNPQFQQTYYDSIIPAMLKLLQDPVPRVVAHNFACFTNIFDKINQVWKIQHCIGQILSMIMFYLKNGSTWIMENAIATLSAFASTKDAFGPNLSQVLEISNQLINSYVGTPEYTQLINQCFELLSHIICFQNKNEVQHYLPNLVSLMLNYRQSISETYFLNSWSRLCTKYQSFTDISLIFDFIMQAAQHLLQQQTDQTGEQALQALSNTCTSFKIHIKPYVPKIITLAKHIYEDKNKSNSLKEHSINLILKAITNIKSSTPQYFQEWKTYSIDAANYFFKSIEEIVQENYSELQYLYLALKSLIQISIQVYSSAQIQQFAVKLQDNLAKQQINYKNLQSEKDQYVSNFDEGQVQSNESQVYILNQSLEALQYCLQNVPQIYKALLLSSSLSIKQWLVNFIAQQSAIYIEKQKEWKLLGINFSIILIQKCQYPGISAIWGNIMSLFVSHSNSPHTRMRNSAVYGMGIVFLKTPIQHTQQANINQWLLCLWNAFSLPYEQDIQQQELIQHSRDNVVSALGKLIYKFGDKFAVLLGKSLYQHWFSQLPLNVDKLEGDVQQHYLNQLLTNNPGMILGKVQDLKNILIEYASFIKKRHEHQNKEIIHQTKETLKIITNWPIFKQSSDFLWSNLSKSQINVLTRFMAN